MTVNYRHFYILFTVRILMLCSTWVSNKFLPAKHVTAPSSIQVVIAMDGTAIDDNNCSSCLD